MKKEQKKVFHKLRVKVTRKFGTQFSGKSNVFIKIFAYTMLLLVLMSVAAVILFARQFLSFYRSEQQRQLSDVFQPIISVMADKNPEEIIEIARRFANNNQSFRFNIQRSDGNVLFSTTIADDLSEDDPVLGQRLRFITVSRLQENESANAYIFTGFASNFGDIDYKDLIQRGFLALVFMLIIAIFGAVLFALKVTKPLEDELRWVRAMEENQRLFFSAASHELKTPVAAARALVEGMIAGVGDYKDHPKYLRECLKTLDAQGALVSEILEIVKFSGNEVKCETVSLDLAELVNAVIAEYRTMAEQRGLLIQIEFSPVRILADHNLLHRVLSNVIVNAVQNTPEGGVIRINTLDKKHIRLCILNTGAQILEDVLPKLFEPFYRMDTARTRRDNQTGLGLAIVKKALDRMQFPFALENTEEGVLFWVDLPAG